MKKLKTGKPEIHALPSSHFTLGTPHPRPPSEGRAVDCVRWQGGLLVDAADVMVSFEPR